jgi:hypothetical protein
MERGLFLIERGLLLDLAATGLPEGGGKADSGRVPGTGREGHGNGVRWVGVMVEEYGLPGPGNKRIRWLIRLFAAHLFAAHLFAASSGGFWLIHSLRIGGRLWQMIATHLANAAGHY